MTGLLLAFATAAAVSSDTTAAMIPALSAGTIETAAGSVSTEDDNWLRDGGALSRTLLLLW